MDYLFFALAFFPISFLPGFNMLLAFSLGLNIGYKATLWAILGQLIGLSIVVAVVYFTLNLIFRYEVIFFVFKFFAAAFLLYTAISFWHAKNAVKKIEVSLGKKLVLLSQGFLCAISNPKAWIFTLSLLPNFANKNLIILIAVIVCVEFVCLSVYALGGSFFKDFMNKHLCIINKISAICLVLLTISLFV